MPPSPTRASLLLPVAAACHRLQLSLGYTNRAMATVADCSKRQWVRWKSGTTLPWPANLARLSAFARAARIPDEFWEMIPEEVRPPEPSATLPPQPPNPQP